LEPYSKEYLDGLLEKARNEATSSHDADQTHEDEEEIMFIDKQDRDTKPLPPLDAQQLLPKPYFSNLKEMNAIPELSQDLVADSIIPSAPPPLPSKPLLDKHGKLLTKRELNELRKKQAKPGYFELPTPDATDLARIRREAEAIRLRNSLDPKKFYRKESVINVKNMPKQIALGTILPTSTPFGTVSADNLTRAERKRSIVDELVEDSEAKSYAKRKFEELQSVHGERGRDTWNRKRIARKSKW